MERQLTAELKRLLVASMGDDLSCHVQSLSEDKVRLAETMMKYASQVIILSFALCRRTVLSSLLLIESPSRMLAAALRVLQNH